MISIKSNSDIKKMRVANKIISDMLKYIEELIKPGISTKYLDIKAQEFLKKNSVVPNFLGYGGFPGAICTSIDSQVVHGIPSDKIILEEGQIVSVDTGCIYQGFHADAARTFAVGKISEEKQKLINVTRESFFKGMEVLKDGVHLGDLGYAIQSYVEKNGFSVVRDYVGHGIGTHLHEDPQVPNYGHPGRGIILKKNMTIAVEPMVNMGKKETRVFFDGWTVLTVDGKPSAHYENTVLITEDGVEILSLWGVKCK